MRIEIPYGRGRMPVTVPDARLRAVLTPEEGERAGEDEAALVRAALERPIGSPRLSDMARGKHRVLVITSDHTRPVPSRVTMPILLSEIRAGSPEAEIVLLVATGMHRKTTEAELRQKYGDDIVDRERIAVHVSTDDSAMTYKGTLPSGGELWINGLVDWAELVVAEGFIEPHFFAGFSGGRKSVLPGIASHKTVLYNHNARFLQDPRACQGSLEGNPIHRDMLYASKAAGLAFILNVLIDGEKRVVAAYAGDPETAHAAGCARCMARARVSRAEADIVVTGNGGYPLDQNVYQSVKGMTAAEACVRPGGAIVLCAALGDGHGGEAFYRWFAEAESPEAVARAIASVPPEETQADQWEAQILARVLLRARCIFVTGEESRGLIEAMHMAWAPDADAALTLAEGWLGANASVTVIPDGVGVIIR